MDEVEAGLSGQAVERRPDAVAAMFPDGGLSISRYVDFLVTAGLSRGLLGPREPPRIWSRHILNCAVIAPAFEPGATAVDIGSGAGLPGMVLAVARPDLHLTLVEPLLRRTTFLAELVAAMRLDNVEVVRARAEDLHGHRTFDVVTSRAVAPLDRLLGLSLPLCAAGGQVIAMRGAGVREELVRVAPGLKKLGAGAVSVETWGARVLDVPTTILRIQSS